MSGLDVVIVSAARTPIGNFCGSFGNLHAHDLGAVVLKAVLQRANVDPADVSEVILGQSLLAGAGQNPARQSSIRAGIPNSVPAYLINMLCGSGMKSVWNGYNDIQTGDAKIVLCGGQESMSNTPHTVYMRNPKKLGNGTLEDSLLHDGLIDAFDNVLMGVTAENLAVKYGLTREQQDTFAFQSQDKIQNALKGGYFDKEIISVPVKERPNSEPVNITKDEFPRATTVEALSKLKPVFKSAKEGGTVTAGNSSGTNDGAAALLIMSKEEAAARNIPVLARIVAFAQSGCDPSIMGIGPVEAVNRLLQKTGWNKNEVDLWELNEAFAAQSLAVLQELKIDLSKVNVNGGAIGLGHPIGSSGARIIVTLLYALERTGGKKGIASLCIGGGMGIAIAIQRS